MALRDLILRESGIRLAPVKKALVMSRLARRLRTLGLRTYGDYCKRVIDDPQELVRMLDRITTNKTSFFREPAQFALLDDEIFPAWSSAGRAGDRPRAIRAWSAGCSTGEEPYSLAMTILEHFPTYDGWHLDVVATDLSTRALQRAREGVYPIDQAEQISQKHRERFMLRGTGADADKMKVGRELRSLVRFRRLNLHASYYDVSGPFDLILCKNVLIYFDPEARLRVISRMLDLLGPEGLLLLGHAESLQGEVDRVRCVLPTVYRPSAREAAIKRVRCEVRQRSESRAR